MSMDFTGPNPWVPTTSSNSIVATMLGIPGISLPITSVRQHIILIDNGVEIGSIETPWGAASVKGSTLSTSFGPSPLNVFTNSRTAFTNFVSALSTSASRSITLKGAVDIKLNLGIFGTMTIPGVGFKATTPLKGLDNLRQTKYVYFIDTNANKPGYLGMSSVINIFNPSSLSLKLGDVQFSTASPEGTLGYSAVKDLVLVPGDNYLLSDTYLDQSLEAGRNFLGGLYTHDGVLTLSGYAESSKNPALNAGLAAVKSTLTIPVAFQGLVPSQAPYKDWSLKVLPSTKDDYIVEISANFQSPYYGYGISMVTDNDGLSPNYVAIAPGVSDTASGSVFFRFINTAKFSTTGSSSTKATFTVQLEGPFTADKKALWTEITNYARANKKLPIELNWFPIVTIGPSSDQHFADWSTASLALGASEIAVGSDFADLINLFP
ncbi:hypothetical protein BX616_005074 [Lobosporangium transversale]|nr:hypothetical protein BX616_005074 [Lobosporangium transversale]